MTLYQMLLAKGIETDSHESDLYFPYNHYTAGIIREWEAQSGVTLLYDTFTHYDDAEKTLGGEVWVDAFGMYDPFWET